MKKIFLTLILILLLASTTNVYAQDGSGSNTIINGSGGNNAPLKGQQSTQGTQPYNKLQNPINADSVEGVILLAVDIAVYIGVSFAILAIIFVGFTFVMAQGKPEEIKKAKEWLLWIIIGLAILISARVIVDVVINTLVKTGVVKESVFKKP